MSEFANKPEAERQQHFIDESGMVGKKIVQIRYTTQDEINTLGWFKKAPILVLDDGRLVYLQKDDEGNDGGMAVVFNPKDGTEKYLPNF